MAGRPLQNSGTCKSNATSQKPVKQPECVRLQTVNGTALLNEGSVTRCLFVCVCLKTFDAKKDGGLHN